MCLLFKCWVDMIYTDYKRKAHFYHLFANSMWHVSLEKKITFNCIQKITVEKVGVRDKEPFLFILPWNRQRETILSFNNRNKR